MGKLERFHYLLQKLLGKTLPCNSRIKLKSDWKFLKKLFWQNIQYNTNSSHLFNASYVANISHLHKKFIFNLPTRKLIL